MRWLAAKDEFVGPDHPDWDESTLLQLTDPTIIDESKPYPSSPSSPSKWTIDKMLNKDVVESDDDVEDDGSKIGFDKNCRIRSLYDRFCRTTCSPFFGSDDDRDVGLVDSSVDDGAGIRSKVTRVRFDLAADFKEADDFEKLVAWNKRSEEFMHGRPEVRAALEEPPHGIVDSDDEEDMLDTPTHLLSGLQAKRRKVRKEREWIDQQRRPFLEAMAAI